MMDYSTLTTNVKMTKPTIQVPGLKVKTLYSFGSVLDFENVVNAWLTNPANKFFAIVSMANSSSVFNSWEGRAINNPPNLNLRTVTFSAVSAAALKVLYDEWIAAHPTYRVARAGYSDRDLAFSLFVEFADDGSAIYQDLKVLTQLALFTCVVNYYDYSPVSVPAPITHGEIPPPCACGS